MTHRTLRARVVSPGIVAVSSIEYGLFLLRLDMEGIQRTIEERTYGEQTRFDPDNPTSGSISGFEAVHGPRTFLEESTGPGSGEVHEPRTFLEETTGPGSGEVHADGEGSGEQDPWALWGPAP